MKRLIGGFFLRSILSVPESLAMLPDYMAIPDPTIDLSESAQVVFKEIFPSMNWHID
jgi:hypothetical protein